jgi:hypothetical protein
LIESVWSPVPPRGAQRDELATRYNKPIYPAWIAGEHWHDADLRG